MGKRKATSEPLVREPNELTDPVVSWLGERLGSVPTVTPNVPSAPSNQVVVSGNSTSLALATSAGSRSHVGFERFVNGLGGPAPRLTEEGHVGSEGVTVDRWSTITSATGGGHVGSEGVTVDQLGTGPTAIEEAVAGHLGSVHVTVEEVEGPVAERFWELLRIAGYELW